MMIYIYREPTRRKRVFLGVAWKFPLQVTHDGRIAQACKEEHIDGSILLILGTTPGERPILPDFGCGILNNLFASNDSRKIALVVYLVRQERTSVRP